MEVWWVITEAEEIAKYLLHFITLLIN